MGIQARTLARIVMPRTASPVQHAHDESGDVDEAEEDAEEEKENEEDAMEAQDYIVRDDSEENTVDITITGDAMGVSLAKEEITNIVGDRISKGTAKIPQTRVSPSLYPFLQGAHKSRVAAMEERFGVKIHYPPPMHSSTGDDSQDPSREPCIIITGDQERVRTCVRAVLSEVDTMRRTTASLSMEIPKRQHKHVIGPKGAHLHELMDVTGCVAEIPAINDPETKITVRGPSNLLIDALKFVMEKANSVATDELDLATFSRDARSGVALAKLLRTRLRPTLRELEKDLNVQLYFVRDTSLIEISGNETTAVAQARSNLITFLGQKGIAHSALVEIPSELHRHPRVRSAINRVKESLPEKMSFETMFVGEADVDIADGLILLVFDGESKKQVKTKNLVQQILTDAVEKLEKAAREAADFLSVKEPVPTKFHRYIIGPKGTTLNTMISECNRSDVPLTVLVGGKRKDSEKSVHSELKIEDDQILVRGARDEVKAFLDKVKKIMEEVKHAEVMSSFTSNFEVPAKYLPHIIGRQGANITKLKDMIGLVRLDFSDPTPQGKVVVDIQGTQKVLKAVEEKIREKVAQLEDETTQNLQIPAEYRGRIIGEGGKYVRRLEEKYTVHINFPSSEDSTSDASNQIVIRGGRKGVAAAAAEIKELYEYEKANSFTDTVDMHSQFIPFLIGKQGARINQLKQFTGARVDVEHSKKDADADESSEKKLIRITLTGNREEVTLAKQVIREVASQLEKSSVLWQSRVITIARDHHRRLIGPSGNAIRELLKGFQSQGKEASGKPKSGPSEEVKAMIQSIFFSDGNQLPPPMQNMTVEVKFPKAGDKVVVRAADESSLEKVVEMLEQKVADLQDEVQIGVRLPMSLKLSVIGRGGTNVRALQDKFQCRIAFDETAESAVQLEDLPSDRHDLIEMVEGGDNIGVVCVLGAESKARACLNELFKSIPFSRSVVVPGSVKRGFLSEGGLHLKRIRTTHQVIIDLPQRKANASNDSDEVWSIRGEPSKVEDAIQDFSEVIKTLLESKDSNDAPKARKLRSFTREIDDIDPDLHRMIIGKGGAKINEIRLATDTDISLTRGSPTIRISGSTEDDVAEAERMIREAVVRRDAKRQ
jgi:transcription antitermination factor NusA-like protein